MEEELKRLGAHIAGAAARLTQPAGRRLDFSPRIQSRASTLCSKASDPRRRGGLELKAVIDGIARVQNTNERKP
jgi:uncharacterized protein YicC (UPF0701 family)